MHSCAALRLVPATWTPCHAHLFVSLESDIHEAMLIHLMIEILTLANALAAHQGEQSIIPGFGCGC